LKFGPISTLIAPSPYTLVIVFVNYIVENVLQCQNEISNQVME